MSDLTVSGPETAAPAAAVEAPAPAAPAPAAPSLFRRVLHRVSGAEAKLVHDPLVDKAGKALVAALVIRGLVAIGAGAGVVSVAEHVLHAVGV